MKQFLSVKDVPDPYGLVQEALALKKAPYAYAQAGVRKTMCLLFFNPSLRTRLSTQKAAQQLGLDVLVMNVGKDSWQLAFEDGEIMNGDAQEHIKEAAGVVSQYCDIIGIRTFPTLTNRERDYQEYVLNKFVAHASVPVVSLESAIRHPLQSLADWMTIEEYRTVKRPKVVLTWAPHPKALPQAVPNSFAEWMHYADVELVIAQPEGYELADEFVRGAKVVYNQRKAFEGADFIYAKNWSSYRHYGQRPEVAENWTVTAEKMALTNQGRFMHCLPVRRNVVVADEVIDSPSALVLQQSNNRTYAAQAVLKNILQPNKPMPL
jgi:N-succinyl-L-ornithine transcarbamylase